MIRKLGIILIEKLLSKVMVIQTKETVKSHVDILPEIDYFGVSRIFRG